MRFTNDVSLGNILIVLSILSVGFGLAVMLTKFFSRVYEMFGWLMEMYFHFCQENGKPIPNWLYQRYRTINGNSKKPGSPEHADVGEFK
jgi:hypothetical protein